MRTKRSKGDEVKEAQASEEPSSVEPAKRIRQTSLEELEGVTQEGAAGGTQEEQRQEQNKQQQEPKAAESPTHAQRTENETKTNKEGKEVEKEKQGGEGAATSGVIEEGRIQFFYRPKVGKDEVDSLPDVQRFYMLLLPSKTGVKKRLFIIGKKRLPSARTHERFFGFVEASGDDQKELLKELGPKSYETKTRGTRHMAGARALGQGTYAVVERKGSTNLVYKLEVPETPGEAQVEFRIGEVGSFIFSVKNPAGRGPDDPGLGEKADYSPEKQQEFGHYSWIPVRDTQLLDYPRCEFLLIAVREDGPGELEQLEQQLEEASKRIQSQVEYESDEEELMRLMKEDIQAEKLGINTEPAETGQMA